MGEVTPTVTIVLYNSPVIWENKCNAVNRLYRVRRHERRDQNQSPYYLSESATESKQSGEVDLNELRKNNLLYCRPYGG